MSNYSQNQPANSSLQIERLPNLMKSQSGLMLLACLIAIALSKLVSETSVKRVRRRH
jgi:hypothetical protein